MTILGISGSLRDASFNSAALRCAAESAPPGVTFDVFGALADIPPFDQDSETDPPAVVADLKQRIIRADAILMSTPEYNYSVPGVLKNAIDWASRPYGQSAWDQKPVAIMSASSGMLGGARAQYHLRQIFVFLNMFPLNKPEVIIPFAADKFDASGRVTDAHTREKIGQLVTALVAWTGDISAIRMIPPEERHPYETAYGRKTKGRYPVHPASGSLTRTR